MAMASCPHTRTLLFSQSLHAFRRSPHPLAVNSAREGCETTTGVSGRPMGGLLPVASPQQLPQHVALIMDGNSRWARQRGQPAAFGHLAGVEALRTCVDCCVRWQVPALTAFAFSNENWQRSQEEVSYLLMLVQRVLSSELSELQRAGVRLRFIGELDRLPASLREELDNAELQTASNSILNFTVALSYSGRQDLTNACRELARRVAMGELEPAAITEELLSAGLSTRRLPASLRQPDLIIRSSGEQRLSNFLL